MKADWLITGAGGQLGSLLFRKLLHRGDAVVGSLSAKGPEPGEGPTVRLDLMDFGALDRLVHEVSPRLIIHTAAVTSVDQAWKAPDAAYRTNVEVTAELAQYAQKACCRLVFLSTDLVFDGNRAPYSESSPPVPLSVYGKTKAEAENAVLGVPTGLVIRPALMYGLPPVDRPTTFRNQLAALRASQTLRLFEDEYRTPLWLEDAAHACIEAAASDFTGVIHIAGPERLSRLDMGRAMARALGVSGENIVPIRHGDLEAPEPRPSDVSLDCALFTRHFGHPPGRSFEKALAEFVRPDRFPSP
jgi:dTDP-4-dehydrorhamnose reductase